MTEIIGHNSIRVEIVTTPEQLQHAYAIRAICFIEEHGVAAQLAIDGNDLQATHIVFYADQEPIGGLRIRWFKDFAKIERTAFRKAYRGPRILKTCSEQVFQHIARKGYTQAVTHARPAYARLWRGLLGFRETGKPPATFDGHPEPYIELVKDLDPPANAISLETEAQVLFRVEGRWDEASRFEARG